MNLRSIWQEQQEAGITGVMFKTQSTKSSRSVAGIALAAMQNALSGLNLPGTGTGSRKRPGMGCLYAGYLG